MLELVTHLNDANRDGFMRVSCPCGKQHRSDEPVAFDHARPLQPQIDAAVRSFLDKLRSENAEGIRCAECGEESAIGEPFYWWNHPDVLRENGDARAAL